MIRKKWNLASKILKIPRGKWASENLGKFWRSFRFLVVGWIVERHHITVRKYYDQECIFWHSAFWNKVQLKATFMNIHAWLFMQSVFCFRCFLLLKDLRLLITEEIHYWAFWHASTSCNTFWEFPHFIQLFLLWISYFQLRSLALFLLCIYFVNAFQVCTVAWSSTMTYNASKLMLGDFFFLFPF